MRTAPAPISQHKLSRLTAWLRLWLIWFAGVFAQMWGKGEGAHARAFDAPARYVAHLIILHVFARLKLKPRCAHRHGRLKYASLRAVAGSALRRATRGRDGAARLFAIFAVLREMDAHVARLLRRLRNGLTRLRVILPLAEAAPAPCAPAPLCIAFADTS